MALYQMQPDYEIGYDISHWQGEQYDHNGYVGPIQKVAKTMNGFRSFFGHFTHNPIGGGPPGNGGGK